MGRIRLTGATSGYTELRAANAAGNNTIILPTTNGGEVIVSDSSGNVNIDSGTFYVDASNNRVGVGTSSPEETLDANGAIVWRGGLNSGKTSAGALDRSGNELRIRAYGATAGTGQLVFRTGGGGGSVDTEAMRIDASQRVGIGTSSPARTFHVVGRSQFQPTTGTSVITLVNTSGGDGSIEVSGTATTMNYGFSTYSTGNALYIQNDGKVGIGTTTMPADSNLTVLGNFQSGFYRNVSSGARGYVINIGATSPSGFIDGASIVGAVNNGDAGGELLFSTRTSGTVTEKVRIDSSGRLLVGTSSPYAIGGFNRNTYIAPISGESDNHVVISATGAGTPGIFFTRTRGSTLTTYTVVQDGDTLGRIDFFGADGVDYSSCGARIAAQVDGTPGSDDLPSRLVFSTTADGASSPTERMRITSSGQVLISCTSFPSSTVKGVGWADNSGTGYFYASAVNTTGDSVHLQFINPNGAIGTIRTNGSATSYNTSSDYRLKENVTAVTDGITRLQQLKPSRFNFITDPDTVVDGFIAHEVQTVVPEAITGEKDAVDEDGNPVYQGIDQSKLVPLLTAALQEAIIKIESLEARLDAANL